jgi:hypothetical protein
MSKIDHKIPVRVTWAYYLGWHNAEFKKKKSP